MKNKGRGRRKEEEEVKVYYCGQKRCGYVGM